MSDIEQELAEHIAGDLVQKINAVAQDDFFKYHLHRTDDSGNSLGFLSAIAFALGALTTTDARRYVVVISSSPSTQTSATVSTVLVVGSDDAKVKLVGDGLKTKLGVKGGGKGPRWSGKFTGVWKASRENGTVDDVLAGL